MERTTRKEALEQKAYLLFYQKRRAPTSEDMLAKGGADAMDGSLASPNAATALMSKAVAEPRRRSNRERYKHADVQDGQEDDGRDDVGMMSGSDHPDGRRSEVVMNSASELDGFSGHVSQASPRRSSHADLATSDDSWFTSFNVFGWLKWSDGGGRARARYHREREV